MTLFTVIEFEDINGGKNVRSCNIHSGRGCCFENMKFINDFFENYLENFHVYYLFSEVPKNSKSSNAQEGFKIKKVVRYRKYNNGKNVFKEITQS